MNEKVITDRIVSYLEDLDKKITVNGELADRTLDLRVPEGTKSNINMDEIQERADSLGIKLEIEEFK